MILENDDKHINLELNHDLKIRLETTNAILDQTKKRDLKAASKVKPAARK